MEILRRAANPWGQEVILGIGFDLLWAAVAAGFAFAVVHTLLIMRLQKAGGEEVAGTESTGRLPERIIRHNLASRVFHWTMAVSMFALLITAFLPIIGFQFDWVTIHWMAGLVLIAATIYHLIRATFFQRLLAVWVGPRDVSEGFKEFRHLIGAGPPLEQKTGKYPVGNKLYHHGAASASIAAIVTGVYMMYRIDTPILQQNQYMLSDDTWGLIYVLHGLAGVGLVLMTITHVYFAIRPEKRWQARSMFKGWITREEYVKYHDPERWAPAGVETEQIEPSEPQPTVGQDA